MTDLFARGAAIFGVGSDDIRWPYDVSGIDRSLRRTDPQRYRQQLTALEEKRLVVVGWAEEHGVKASTVNCCPWWLTRKVSRRCHLRDCTHYGASPRLDSHWLDHTICWLKDGKPAVITSAPYHVNDEDRARIEWWTSEQPALRAAFGAGWYGFGTSQIVIWRADRIDAVRPAAAA